MPNPSKLIQRRKELLSYLGQARDYKAKTIKFVHDLEAQLNNKEILLPEFGYRLNKALKYKSLQDWVDYYNDLISQHNKELIKIDNEIKRNESSKHYNATILITLMFILLSISSFILIKPELTGFAVYQPGTIINETVTLTIPENITIDEIGIIVKLNVQESKLPLTEFNIIENLVNVDLNKFNIKAEEGTLFVVIVYNDTIIGTTSLEINLQENITLLEPAPVIEENITFSGEEAIVEQKVEEKLLEKDKVRVLLRKKQEINKDDVKDLIKNKINLNIKQEVDDYYAVEVDKQDLEKLKKSNEIEEIRLDEEVSLFVNESIVLTSIDKVKSQGLSGQGKSVCILDTGINYNLFNLQLNNTVFGYDFVNNDNDPLDDHGHGTSVSSIILNTAPNAKIYSVKVINNNGIGYYSDVLAGLQYCINNNIDVISLSIGAALSTGYCDNDLVASKVNSAVDSGIFVVASTGNDGSSNSIRVPACASKVTRVSSSTKQDSIASFANINNLIDLLAPGKDINTIDLNGNNVVLSGTSFSVPFVSGSVLLILENRSLLPSELTYLLRSTSEIINYNNILYNRLNLFNALINNKTNEPYNYDANQTIVEEEPFKVQQQNFFVQKNYTFYYNVSGNVNEAIGEWTVFNRSVGGGNGLDGSNDTNAECNQGVNLRTSDDVRCVLTERGSNFEPWIRFNFTINEAQNGQMSNITSVRIILEGVSGSTDAVKFQQYNRTGGTTGSYSAFGATTTTTEATRIATYRNLYDIQQVLSNITNQTILRLEGTNHDLGETIAVDFVQVVVNVTNYTLVNSDSSFNAGYPQINSTTGINQTTEDLFATFSATDTENSTISFNVTWFSDNKTNFTTVLQKNYAINTMNRTTLDKGNLTVGQTWIAMVNLFDGQFISRANTTELLILNSPPNLTSLYINSTSPQQLNQTIETLQVRFNASDPNTADILNYSIQWITNNATNFTLTNIAISNPGATVENLNSRNLTKGQTWKAQVLVCDNNNVCNNYQNTTELLIANTPPQFQVNPVINGTNGLNTTAQDLNVFFTPNESDVNDLANLNYSVQVFTNNVSNFSIFRIGTSNGTFTNFVINKNNLTAGQTWMAMVWVGDGSTNSTYQNTSELLISVSSNTAPNNPTNLILNSSNTAHTNKTDENLLMNFQCDDPDVSDTLTFHLTAFKDFENKFQIQGSCNDPENKTVILNALNTTKNDNWSFSVNVSDNSDAYSATASTVVNLSILNTAPIIGNVTLDEADPISIVENGNKTFRFSFVVTDADNQTDIINSSAVANITRGFGNTAETTRYNDTFVNVNDGGCYATNNVGVNGKNFSCIINVVFYDGAGEWNISVRINDSVKRTDIVDYAFAQNITKTFTIAETSSISINPSTLSFPIVIPGSYNISSLINLTIRNIGNDDLSGREATGETINITAVTLVPSSGSTFIPASNFSIGQVNGTSGHNLNFCDTSITANVTRLQNTTVAQGWANFTGAINGSSLPARANENSHTVGLCLLHAPSDLANQQYSSLNSGAWTITIFFFRRRKNIYEKNKKIINEIINLKIYNKISDKELISLINYERLIAIPISIFKNSSPLESLVKYLKENLSLSLNEISSLLNRDQRTIWITYTNARRKKIILNVNSKISIPVKIFNNRNLSILENSVNYLIKENISMQGISKLLNRNYKTIWTCYNRAKKKTAKISKEVTVK